MKGIIFICIIMCVVLPLGALAYIIYSLAKFNKSKKHSDERIMDIITEYEIKAEKKKNDKNTDENAEKGNADGEKDDKNKSDALDDEEDK